MSVLLQLTYWQVFIAVLAHQLGLPVPSMIFLMAAGAQSAHRALHPIIIVAFGVVACLTADGVWFWIGRKWGSKALGVLCRFSDDPRACARNAQEKFRRYGLPLLCVAKFVPGLATVMPPLAGAEGVAITNFVALDAIGSLVWSGSYLGLGYLFSKELNLAIRWVQHFGTALGMVIAIPIALYAAWRGLVLVRMICELRHRRIAPPVLARKLESDGRVAVLDLANFEEETASGSLQAIPGAFVLDPSVLRKAPQIAVPDDLKIILCCPSGSATVSARAAVGLKRIGIDKVWVLDGGLKAWREHGLPVSRCPDPPEVVAERYGVKLPGPTKLSE